MMRKDFARRLRYKNGMGESVFQHRWGEKGSKTGWVRLKDGVGGTKRWVGWGNNDREGGTTKMARVGQKRWVG